MRVLVTGSSGFIGTIVCSKLLSLGHSVRGFDLRPGTTTGLESIQGDVRDEHAVRGAVAGMDIVVHLAAIVSVTLSEREPERVRDVNSNGAVAVGRAALASSRMVFVSSAAVYGPRSGAIDEDAACEPSSVYGRSKLEAEQQLHALATDRPGWLVTLRPFNVYGAGQAYRGADTPLIAAIAHAIETGDPLTVRGDGSQRRDYVHVDDAAAAIAQLATQPGSVASRLNLATGSGRSVLDVVTLAEKVTGARIPRHHTERQQSDVMESFADITRLKAAIPSYAPAPLEEGLSRTLDRVGRAPEG